MSKPRNLVVFAIFIFLTTLFFPSSTFAAELNKGLYISPLRKSTTVDSGIAKADFFTVANHTNKNMTVTLSIKQFSALDYSNDLLFTPPENNWVKLITDKVDLIPEQSAKIYYDIEVPAKTAPGGHYYTFVASSEIAGEGLPTTVQTTSLLYLTVNGNLIRTSILKNSSIPWFVTGNTVPYKFDVENLGNVYFSAFAYGQIDSIFGPLPEVGASHILMPNVVRAVSGEIPSPSFPGIYQVTYGYRVDFADFIVTKTSYIVYAPPWSFVALVFIALVGIWSRQQRNKHKKTSH